MRRFYFGAIILLLLCGASAARQQAPTTGEAVKKDLLKLFKLCSSGLYSKAAGHLVYRGPDKAREWVDIYHYQNPAERNEVESIVRSIKALLERSDSYKFSKFVKKAETEGEWYVWEVSFRRGEKEGKVSFAFLKIRGRYALGDIDGHLA